MSKTKEITFANRNKYLQTGVICLERSMFESLEKSSASRCQLSGKSEAENTNFETDTKYVCIF